MKLFITGISGLLGRHSAVRTSRLFEVSGCYFNSPVSIDGINTFQLDVTNRAQTEEALENLKPDVILHTAAMTNVDDADDTR